MKLRRLTIENFKGVKRFEFAPEGHNASITGANATGKSTVGSAFTWLLMGKDMQGRAEFAVKPLDANGDEKHGLETTVEAVVDIDGAEHVLRKVMSENWQRPKGRPEAVFAGNVTAYSIDGLPVKAKEYAQFIAEHICPEELAPLVLTVRGFAELSNAAKRTMLVRYLGQGAEVPLEGRFAALDQVLAGMTPEQARKRVKVTRDKLNAEIATIPVRVDETSRAIIRCTAEAEADARWNVKDIQADIERIDAQIAAEKASGPAMVLDSLREKLQAQMQRHANSHELLMRRMKLAEAQKHTVEAAVADARAERAQVLAKVEEAQATVCQLRKQWGDINREEAHYEDITCPTCGQTLQHDAAARIAQAKKAERLKEIKRQGQSAADVLTMHEERLEAVDERMSELRTYVTRWHEEHETCAREIAELQEPQECVDLRQKIAELESTQSGDGHSAQLEQRKAELQKRLEKHQKVLYQIEQSHEAEKRVAELNEKKAELGREIARCDGDLYLLEEYIIEGCKRLESGVNAHFSVVKWQLFDLYDNGNYRDACIPTINGVPFEFANTAAQINAGIEISSVLAKAAGVNVPLFVDRAESVNNINSTLCADRQVIALYVNNSNVLEAHVYEQ